MSLENFKLVNDLIKASKDRFKNYENLNFNGNKLLQNLEQAGLNTESKLISFLVNWFEEQSNLTDKMLSEIDSTLGEKFTSQDGQQENSWQEMMTKVNYLQNMFNQALREMHVNWEQLKDF